MGLFIVGLLTGIFLGILGRDIIRYITFWFLVGIAGRQRKRKIKDTIKKLEDHINEE